eukprot:6194497-Pleurochrysis_carterae.AAC.1
MRVRVRALERVPGACRAQSRARGGWLQAARALAAAPAPSVAKRRRRRRQRARRLKRRRRPPSCARPECSRSERNGEAARRETRFRRGGPADGRSETGATRDRGKKELAMGKPKSRTRLSQNLRPRRVDMCTEVGSKQTTMKGEES